MKSLAMKIEHGLRKHPLYRIWAGMRYRCETPTNSGYRYYGARGIVVCERWHTFKNFCADMGDRPTGTTLDRKENNGNYEPNNCRWATAKEQAANRRDNGIRTTNRVLIIDGKKYTLTEAAKKWEVKRATLWMRLALGWSEVDAARTKTRLHKTYEQRST